MQFELTQSGKGARAVVRGEIDERGAEELKRSLGEIKLSEGINVVLDFGDVTHIGSSGLGKLLLFYKFVASHKGSIRIERLDGPLFDLFQQLKLNTIFTAVRK